MSSVTVDSSVCSLIEFHLIFNITWKSNDYMCCIICICIFVVQIHYYTTDEGWRQWRNTVGRTPVFGWRTDPVLRSACSLRVTTVWVNRPLQVSQLGQLSLSSSEIDKWVAGSFNRMCAVAPSDECLWGESPPDRMLAIPWRRLCLAAFGLNLVVVAVLRDRLLWRLSVLS